MLQRLPGEIRLSMVHPTLAAVIALAAMALLSGCSKSDSPAVAEKSPQQLFIDYCASCHGSEGRGNGPVARELRVAPSNLRLLKQKNGGKFPTRRVQGSIDGRGMPPAHGLPEMPVWGAMWKRQGLSEAQVRARIISIASYIDTIQD